MALGFDNMISHSYENPEEKQNFVMGFDAVADVRALGYALVPEPLLTGEALRIARLEAAAAASTVPLTFGRRDYVDIPCSTPWVTAVANAPALNALVRQLLWDDLPDATISAANGDLSYTARVHFKTPGLPFEDQVIHWHQVRLPPLPILSPSRETSWRMRNTLIPQFRATGWQP